MYSIRSSTAITSHAVLNGHAFRSQRCLARVQQCRIVRSMPPWMGHPLVVARLGIADYITASNRCTGGRAPRHGSSHAHSRTMTTLGWPESQSHVPSANSVPDPGVVTAALAIMSVAVSPSNVGLVLEHGFQELISYGAELPCSKTIQITNVVDFDRSTQLQIYQNEGPLKEMIKIGRIELKGDRAARSDDTRFTLTIKMNSDLTGQATLRDDYTGESRTEELHFGEPKVPVSLKTLD